jgi:hypothetical protein
MIKSMYVLYLMIVQKLFQYLTDCFVSLRINSLIKLAVRCQYSSMYIGRFFAAAREGKINHARLVNCRKLIMPGMTGG